MKDPQHWRQFLCYGIAVSRFDNYLCVHFQSELVSLEIVAVNFCLGGSIIPGVLVSLLLSKLLLDAVGACEDC